MREKIIKLYLIIKLVLFSLISAEILVIRLFLLEHLRFFIGGLLILYAVEEFSYALIFERKNILARDKFFVGAVEFVFGIVVLIFDLSFESVCVVWGTWSILRESFEIREMITETKHIPVKIISGIESTVVLILFTTLIISPTEHEAGIHLYVMLPELLLNPLVPLIDLMLPSKKKN